VEEAVKQPGDPSPWADNVSRLAGLHGLSHDQLAKLLDMSPQTISTWRSGKRRPSGDAFLAVGEFFEIDPVQLNQRSFEGLLSWVSDPERFKAVEAKIKRSRIRVA
jgi:transcriptional regulator with XRE-family HTH domain